MMLAVFSYIAEHVKYDLSCDLCAPAICNYLTVLSTLPSLLMMTAEFTLLAIRDVHFGISNHMKPVPILNWYRV